MEDLRMADSRHITRRAAIVGALTLTTSAAMMAVPARALEAAETEGATIYRIASELSDALTNYGEGQWQMIVRPHQIISLQPLMTYRNLGRISDGEIDRAYFAYLQNERQILARQIYGIGRHQEGLRYTPCNTGFDFMGNRVGWDNLIDARARGRQMLSALGVVADDFI